LIAFRAVKHIRHDLPCFLPSLVFRQLHLQRRASIEDTFNPHAPAQGSAFPLQATDSGSPLFSKEKRYDKSLLSRVRREADGGAHTPSHELHLGLRFLHEGHSPPRVYEWTRQRDPGEGQNDRLVAGRYRAFLTCDWAFFDLRGLGEREQRPALEHDEIRSVHPRHPPDSRQLTAPIALSNWQISRSWEIPSSMTRSEDHETLGSMIAGIIRDCARS
jgi:hypothetical protein